MSTRIIRFFLIVSIFFIFLPNTTFALSLNEIYPAPAGGENEWIEIYNETTDTVDLSNYVVNDSTGKQINFEGSSISGGGLISAISKNVLNNSGDTVTLKKQDGTTVDVITYPKSLDDKKSYARCPDGPTGNWITTETITKNSTNNNICSNPPVGGPTLIPTNEPSQIVSTSVPDTPSYTTYHNLYISEAMVNPKTGEHEWIELYNDNDFDVSLTDWFIDDGENSGSTPKKFTLTIPAKRFGIVELSSSMFNNDGDSIRLIDQNLKVYDSINYSSSEQDKTIGKTVIQNNYTCNQNPTKSSPNGSCIESITTVAVTQTKSPSIAPTEKSKIAAQTVPVKDKAEQTPGKKLPTQSNFESNNIILREQAPESPNTVVDAGEVLGEQSPISTMSLFTVRLIKAISGSAYLLSLLSATLTIKRIIKKVHTNYT